MDPQSTPFPGKLPLLRSRTNRSTFKEHKTSWNETPFHRQKRVFGTSRNTNVPAKTNAEKPLTKPSARITTQQQKPKASRKIPTKPSNKQSVLIAEPRVIVEAAASSTDAIAPNPAIKAMVKESSSANNRSRSNRSVCFQEPIEGNVTKIVKEESNGMVRTPLSSLSVGKPRRSGTPYHSAENCSNCRHDKLQTSRYWLEQIRLAESVGKHFVSAAFFRLAFESNAQPFRTLRLELRRYLSRHESLSAETQWRDVVQSFEQLQDETGSGGLDLGRGKESTSATRCKDDVDQDQKYSQHNHNTSPLRKSRI